MPLGIRWVMLLFHKKDETSNPAELYVDGFPLDSTEEEIRTVFEAVGPVKSVSIVQRNGQPLGFAYVTYANKKDAHLALAELLENAKIRGGKLRVLHAPSGRIRKRIEREEAAPMGCCSSDCGECCLC